MNYYQHHIGDFIRDTARLTDAQCMAYLRILWIYYETEEPIENDIDAVAFKIGASASDVTQIFKHFFFFHDDGLWHQARCDKEILAFRKKSEKAKKSAEARWNNANAMRTHTERNAKGYVSDANQNPVTSNHKPNKKNVPKYSERDFKAAGYFLETILTDQPDFKHPNLDKWADDIRLMRERDSRTYDDIHKVWKWARNNTFWKKNILSPAKFRDKFDQLKANMLEKPNGKQYLDPDDTTWAFGPDANGSADGEYDLPPIEGDFSRLDGSDQGH